MDRSSERADLQGLVERRGALRARMVEIRASEPEDHEGFLRTVDQLLAVSNQIMDELNAAGTAEERSADGVRGDEAGGAGPGRTGAAERRAQEGAAGGAEDDTR